MIDNKEQSSRAVAPGGTSLAVVPLGGQPAHLDVTGRSEELPSVAHFSDPGGNPASCYGVPIRIGFVLDAIDTWGAGTEKHLSYLLSALDRRYFAPELYFLRVSSSLRRKDFPCPVHVVSPLGYGGVQLVPTLFRLARLLRRHRPQIVQTFFVDGVLLGSLAAWLARVPVIVASRRNAGYFLNGRLRRAFQLADFLIDVWQCNSPAVSAFLQDREGVNPGKIHVLPNAIDLDAFAPTTPGARRVARLALDLPMDAPVFVAVSNLRPVKKLDTLVEAAARVRAVLPKVKFLVVGDGPLRSTLAAQIARLQLGDTVRLDGTRESVAAHLAAADLGILTSSSEGCSNALLEYMACGLPAVVSDIPANRELVPGVFFPPSDAKDLSEKLLSLWRDRDEQGRLRQSYQQIAAGHDYDHVRKLIQSFYVDQTAA